MKLLKTSLVIMLMLISMSVKSQTSTNIDANAMFASFVESAKSYNEDFQKEVKAFIASIENSNIVKNKAFSGGFGMNMIVDFNNQFMIQISCYNTVLVKKSFKKKDELVLFLKAMVK